MTGRTKSDEAQAIRNRIQNAAVSSETVIIPPLPSPTIQDPSIKKVAAYTRVSTNSLEQVSSIENQTRYYTDVVEKRPEWELYRIYSDEGKSGTSRRQRTEFNQMLQDAADEKFDVIMCASVSRFARNVKDFLQVIKNLKNQNPMHPVGVFFETENCYTLNPDSDTVLDMHAMFAAWESRNRSMRMILSYDQRICTGQYPIADLLGFRHTKDGRLIIHEDEALTVKFIFLAYLGGYSCAYIAELLTEKQRSTLKGRTEWNASMVWAIMSNERRWGDLNARKRIVIDYEEHKTIKNEGAKRRYAAFVPNHHEGIVSREIAKAIPIVSESNSRIGRGIRELAVIKKGRMTGFVSIFPCWTGFDAKILMDISEIINSRSEKILPISTYRDYKRPALNAFITRNTPSITVKQGRLCLNAKLIEVISDFEYVEFLYHPTYQVLCLRSCERKSSNAFSLNDTGVASGNVRCPALSKILLNTKGCDTLKVRGIKRSFPKGTAVLFYLNSDYTNSFNTLCEEDVNTQAVAIENPMLGTVPTRVEILQAVEELMFMM